MKGIRTILKGLSGYSYYSGLSSSAGRGMNTHNLAHRYGTEAKGIIVPQVILGGKRQFYNIIYTVYVIGSNSQFLHFLTVKRSVMIHTFHSLFETNALDFTKAFAVHAFDAFIPNHVFRCITIINGYYQYSCKVNKKILFISKILPNIAASKKRK